MIKRVAIIGEKSFIGTNLFEHFKKRKIKVSILNYNYFFKKKIYNKNFSYIINCSSNKNFVKRKYSKKFDHDLNIANKIKKLPTKLVLLSSRKIYEPKFNIKEDDKKKPKCNYSKNKLTSENKVKLILKNKALILRISNLIGYPKKNNRKLHDTFIDIFLKNINKDIIYKNSRVYKDFISVKKFSEIILKLIKLNSVGIYNVSLGKKVYLDKLIYWLNKYNKRKITILKLKKSFNTDSFTLNNHKLMKKIKTKNNISELKYECLKLSKLFFKYKNLN